MPTRTICKCGQPVETPEEMGGQVINCPSCGVFIQLAIQKKDSQNLYVYSISLFIGVLGLCIIAFMATKPPPPAPPEKTWSDFDKEAIPLMMAEASNHIVGISRIVDAFVWKGSNFEDANQWTGDVTAEFINKVGGVERITEPYIFAVVSGENFKVLKCMFDYKRSMKQFEEKLEAEQKAFDAETKHINESMTNEIPSSR